MASLKRKEKGFTIVELLIVIVVIGILAALVITTFTGIQQKARDTERQTDIKAVEGQLEGYYAENGKYPTLANLNDLDWVKTNLKGLDKEALKSPTASGTTPYQLGGTAPSASDSTAVNKYFYVVTASDGTTACDNSTVTCAKYQLIAPLESSTTPFEKDSLN